MEPYIGFTLDLPFPSDQSANEDSGHGVSFSCKFFFFLYLICPPPFFWYPYFSYFPYCSPTSTLTLTYCHSPSVAHSAAE